MGKRWLLVVASIGVILLALLAIAGSSELHPAHFGWPAWVGVGVVALAGVLASPSRKVLDIFLDRLLSSFTLAFNRSKLIKKVPGYRMLVSESSDRIMLNIHPAIPLAAGSPPGLSDEFPLYVERDIDANLRAWVKSRSERSCLIILVGPAASGKTRLLSEAFRAALPDWQLLRPSSEQINALVEANANLARSVLWLDELQRFFEGDPLRAATVEALLAGRHGPVVVAGTIRSEERARLLGKIATGDREMTVNANAILRMTARWSGLLEGNEHTVQFDVAGQFSPEEALRASVLSSADPRLRMALQATRGGDFTATLACEAELIGRWRGGDNRNGQAVITAAVVARLCGHPEPLGEDVLAVVALTYLSGLEAAPENTEWLSEALQWAKIPVFASSSTSAIRAVRTEPGRIDGYRVSDILVQNFQNHDYPDVRRILDSDETWRLVLKNAPGAAAAEIALSAYKADKLEVARDAWLVAADRGDVNATRSLGLLFWEQDQDTEAERWLRRAVEFGSISAMISLADWLSLHEQAAEAQRLLDRAALAGSPDAMRRLGFQLGGQGDLEAAEDWTRKAAELGNVTAMANLGYRLAMRGELTEAEAWDLKAARLGFPGAMQNLGDLYRNQEKLTEALVWYSRAAERAYDDVMANPRRFHPWPGEGRDDGTSNAMLKLAELLQQTGQSTQAEAWYHRGTELGDPRAATALAAIFEGRGDVEGAADWRQRAATLAEANLARNHASIRNAYGEPELLRNTAILVEYADHLTQQQRQAESARWYRLAADFGDQVALSRLP